MDQKKEKEFLSKLRQPIHKTYIQKYLLKVSEKECTEILENYVRLNIIEESKYSKGYYVIKELNRPNSYEK